MIRGDFFFFFFSFFFLKTYRRREIMQQQQQQQGQPYQRPRQHLPNVVVSRIALEPGPQQYYFSTLINPLHKPTLKGNLVFSIQTTNKSLQPLFPKKPHFNHFPNQRTQKYIYIYTHNTYIERERGEKGGRGRERERASRGLSSVSA